MLIFSTFQSFNTLLKTYQVISNGGRWETKIVITLPLPRNGYGLTEKTDMQINDYKLSAPLGAREQCARNANSV